MQRRIPPGPTGYSKLSMGILAQRSARTLPSSQNSDGGLGKSTLSSSQADDQAKLDRNELIRDDISDETRLAP